MNGVQLTSWEALKAGIVSTTKAMLKWVATNPFAWIGIAAGAVATFIGVVNHFAVTAEKLNDQLQELKATEEELISTQDKLTEIDNKIAEIQSKGTLSITDNADISRLQTEKSLLEDEIELLKIRKELQQDEYNKNAKRYADGQYSNYTHGQGNVSNLIKDYKGYKAKSERTDIDPYFVEDAKEKLKETKADLIEYRNTLNENIANLAPDDEESRKKLETIREAIEKLIYTEEELVKIKFDRFIINPNNTGISEGFEKIKSDGEVTTQEITELASKFPTLKKFMDDNGISAEMLAAELNNVGKKAENSGENVNEMTVSLSELESASDKIKTLGSAFKELSDDGYITTKTLGEIQTATGLSGNEWSEYESKLLNAKKGSAEFSQIMADLTYKMLDQTFANKDLNSLTEQQISAILRENGVVNADAVAHDWLTKAKETLRIKTALAKAGTAEEVVALATEASQAGITGNALNDLIMDMGIFNNTNLDVSQKVAALQEMGYYAHWTAQGLASIDKVKKYSFDGKDYIASYDKDGKLVGIEQEKQVEIPNVEIPKITIPNYRGVTSGGKGSGSGSDNKPDYEDPTEAIINRINLRSKELEQQEEYIQNALEIAEIEKDYEKQISLTNDKLVIQRQRLDTLKTANEELHGYAEGLRNSTPQWREEEWFDSQGNATEAYNSLYNSSSNDEQEKIKNQFEKISKIKKSWVDNDKEIVSLNKEILQDEEKLWDIRREIFDERLEQSEYYIKHSKDFGWENADNEIKARKRILEWIQSDYYRSLIKDDEEYYKILEEHRLNYKEALKDEFDKTNDFASTFLDSSKTLLQSYYDVTNSIAEAQHEINKELETSKTMYEWLDEDTRKLLFNQEDYNALSEELYDIQYKADKLQRQYERDLENSTLNTIEEITSNYEMQYETLMKSYEIAKADLEIAKKKQKLNNVLNERNVRMFINGQWQWVANTEDVINAKSELADAEYAKRVEESGLTQQKSIDNLTKQQDELGTIINMFENGIIDLDTALQKVTQMFSSLPTAIEESFALIWGRTGSSSGGGKGETYSYSGISYDPNFDYSEAMKHVPEGSDAWNNMNRKRNAKILGEKLDYKPFATGTRYTPEGNLLLGEKEPEVFINNNGHYIPINQPTLGKFGSGGTVFNQDQLSNLRTLWDLSSVKTPDYSSLVNRYDSHNVTTHYDYSVTIKDLVVDNGVNGQELVNALRRYVGNH